MQVAQKVVASPTRLLNCDEMDTAEAKKSTKPVVAPEAPTPKVAETPKEAEPPVQKMPDQPQQADVVSPTEHHLPPKLELKREKEMAQLQIEHQTVVSSPSHLPAATHTQVTAMHAALPDSESVPEKIPKEWEDNMDRVIDEVAKGNFSREDDYDFYNKKKSAGRPSKNRGEIDQLSPRAKALLGLTEPGVSPTPVQVPAKGHVQQPPQAQQHIPPAQQQLASNQQHQLPPAQQQLASNQQHQLPPAQQQLASKQQHHLPPRSHAQQVPISNAIPQVQQARPQVASTASVIQQTPHTQGMQTLYFPYVIFKSTLL